MKKHTFALSIAAAIATSLSGLAMAQTTMLDAHATPAMLVSKVVNNQHLFTIDNSHLKFLSRASASNNLDDSVQMNHLQLILQPGDARHAQMEAFIANQHDRSSPNYKHWLTPAQFGNAFGASDSDIAAVTAWLSSQGFTVNTVYPNKLQVDFSGTAGQIKQAFHTQEAVYTFGAEQHLANSSNLSIPAAFKDVVAGVMGLNDFHEASGSHKAELAQRNPATGKFESMDDAASTPDARVIKQSITFQGQRALVPNDMARIYNTMPLRQNGVTGTGVTIAIVENGGMQHIDWDNFVTVFNLAQYGGSLTITNPAPPSGDNNCYDPNVRNAQDFSQPLTDSEWATAMAPGADIVLAVCSNTTPQYHPASTNSFGGVFIAATNLINADTRPNIISASYSQGELVVDSASKIGVDDMWAQADAEGISVFVTSGDSGSAPNYNYGVINGIAGDKEIDANALATSPHVTAVGGTDLADILDGTTSKYFAPNPSVVGGSALGYVPEIPWNQSCGNGVAAKAAGFNSAVAFCKNFLNYDYSGTTVTGVASSGGASIVDAKPAWQNVYNVPQDQARDIPDVSLFGGSFGHKTYVVSCTATYPCKTDFSGQMQLQYGNSVSTSMMAGIQAVMDQGLHDRGLPLDQGNAAPVLYALAAQEYGDSAGPGASLATCNADNGAGTKNCIFHNVTRGAISSQCEQVTSVNAQNYSTAHCYYYGRIYLPLQQIGYVEYGLTTADAAPTSYTAGNKAWGAQPGWSFASGLGSVDAKNLLIAWRAFDHATPAVSR